MVVGTLMVGVPAWGDDDRDAARRAEESAARAEAAATRSEAAAVRVEGAIERIERLLDEYARRHERRGGARPAERP
jgi:hypothetical protein